MSIKVERKLPRYANVGQNCEEYEVRNNSYGIFVYNILQRYVIPDPEFLSKFC